MNIARWAVALLLTVMLLYVARTTSRGRPEFQTHTENGYTFEYTTVPKITEKTTDRLTLKITGPFEPGVNPVIRQVRFRQDSDTPISKYGSVPLLVEDSATGLYSTPITAGDKGGKTRYYFEVRDNIGGRRAVFLNPDNEPFVLKYIGEVPTVVVALHIFFMFATVYFVVLGMLHGLNLVRGGVDIYAFGRAFFLATVCAFVGGYPFGFMMNAYAFGVIWEGVPFGTDATDNKTQLLFVYLVLVALASIGSWSRGKLGRDIFSPKTLGWLGTGSFFLLLGIYLIPHSIQFAPLLTKIVCWSWISLVAVLYLLGLYLSQRDAKSKGKARSRISGA
ncbi:MAG: hypothetical protein KOO62_12090 [candidate division Zixibacteria bacterium]|nr:hypothetical protein [candidate division Zixibacteria bacterium]